MLIICGQCRYRFQTDGESLQGGAICPRCGHPIVAITEDEDQLAGDGEAEPEAAPADAAEEDGFAEVARQTAGRKVNVVCGSCGKALKVSARIAGKKRRCPGCNAKILIPYPEDDEDVAFLRRAIPKEGGMDLQDGHADLLSQEELEAGREEDIPTVPAHHRAGEKRPRPLPPPAHRQGPGQSRGADEEEESAAAQIADDIVLVEESAAPATLDLDVGRRRRIAVVVVAVAAILSGMVVASYFLFIRPREMPVPVAGAPEGNGLESVQPPTTPAPATPKPIAQSGGGDAGLAATSTPAPTAAPSSSEPRCEVGKAITDIFLCDGYFPAAPDRTYWKVDVELTAGARPMTVKAFGTQAVLAWPGAVETCSGELEPGSWPSQRLVRREIVLEPNQSAKARLVFVVPRQVSEAKLQIAGFKSADVRPFAGPSAPGGALWAGTYAETPPRNLQPLLKGEVAAALESAPKLSLVLIRNGDHFDLSMPPTSITGRVPVSESGILAVSLRKGNSTLECKLRAASGGRAIVLYLGDAPFHQLTFTLPAPPPGR